MGDENAHNGELAAVAGAIRAWLPILDARAEGSASADIAVWMQVRNAALMALGAIEDDLGVGRTVPSRRERRVRRRRYEGGARGA